MISTDKQIFLLETEIKPNKYARIVLLFTFIITAICLILTEAGAFRVDVTYMRIGTIITGIVTMIPLILVTVNKDFLANPKIKYIMIFSGIMFTLCVTTFLTFHTTLMLTFPIFMAMLYRSRTIGVIAVVGSLFCTLFSSILGYILHTWDVPLFQELILIATNSETVIPNPTEEITLLSVGKILLYLSFPRLLMVGACSIVMFKNISLAVDHVNNQILINNASQKDILTGLYNRNFYDKLVKDKEFTGDVGVIFFGVNGLKAANDSRGHEYGDLLLKRAAKSIADVCDGETSHGFRMGGDEFLILIEGAHEAELVHKLGDWISALGKVNEENAKQFDGLKIAMAAGYAFGEFKDIESITAKADERMYRNKQSMKLGE